MFKVTLPFMKCGVTAEEIRDIATAISNALSRESSLIVNSFF
jgi:PP-loop superfamily ATP-utilizing enzyme